MKHCKDIVLQRQIPEKKDISKRKLKKFRLILNEVFDKCNKLVSINIVTYAVLRRMTSDFPFLYKFGIRIWRKRQVDKSDNAEHFHDLDKDFLKNNEGWQDEELSDMFSFLDDRKFLYFGNHDGMSTRRYCPIDDGSVGQDEIVATVFSHAGGKCASREAKQYFSSSAGYPSTATDIRRNRPHFLDDEASTNTCPRNGGLFESSYFCDSISSHLVTYEMKEEYKTSHELYSTKNENSESYQFFAIWPGEPGRQRHQNLRLSRENVYNTGGTTNLNDKYDRVSIRQTINDLCTALKTLTENTHEERGSDVHFSSSSTRETLHEENKDGSEPRTLETLRATPTSVSVVKRTQKRSKVERRTKSSFPQTADILKERAEARPLKKQQNVWRSRKPENLQPVSKEPTVPPQEPKSKTSLRTFSKSSKNVQIRYPEVKRKPVTIRKPKQEEKPVIVKKSKQEEKPVIIKKSKQEEKDPSIQDIKAEKKALKQKADLKFAQQFQAHAKQTDGAKTGIVISKYKSHHWLKKAGLFQGIINANQADESFFLAAGTGVVLNIHGYMRYLRKISIGSKIKFQDLVQRLAECPPPERKPKNLETKQAEQKTDDADNNGTDDKQDIALGEKNVVAISQPMLPFMVNLPTESTTTNDIIKKEISKGLFRREID